jgi:hypothetical protein
VIGGALSLGGPVAYGLGSGHLAQGMLTALGALAASGVAVAPGRYTVRLGYAFVTATAAGLLGAAIAGRGWAMALVVVAVAGVVSVLGGFSRTAAESTTRFVTFLAIATGLGPVAGPVRVAVVFALGAAWATLVALVVGLLGRSARPAVRPVPPPFAARPRRWRRSLRGLPGRQYPLRLMVCLAVAEAVGLLWHQDKAYWIAVTVAIVVRRRLDGALVRAVQRAAGTAAGVLAGTAFVWWAPPPWSTVVIVTVLAGIRPLLKARNYALYATVMTPLVVLLLDAGAGVTAATIGYRLADTVVGCAIALGVGYLPWLRLRPAERPAPRSAAVLAHPSKRSRRGVARDLVGRPRDLVARVPAGPHRRAAGGNR